VKYIPHQIFNQFVYMIFNKNIIILVSWVAGWVSGKHVYFGKHDLIKLNYYAGRYVCLRVS